jgi:hypothetical protein
MKNPSDIARAQRPLYRTILSVAIAAVVAAWLPFTVFYVSALSHKPAAMVASVTYGHNQRIVTTRTSSGPTVRTIVGSGGQLQTQTAQPLTTRVS